MKPGYATTEFWIALFTQALAVLAITGVISPGDQAGLGDALAHAVTAFATICASWHVVSTYVQGRIDLKHVGTGAAWTVAPSVPPEKP